MAGYEVLEPSDKRYQQALGDFWNYVLVTPPRREPESQPGKFFFIRAHKLEDGLPVCRVGRTNRAIVRKDQLVFLPVMVSVADSQNHNAPTIQDRRRIVNVETSMSEPPEEMTAMIDGVSVYDRDPQEFYVETERDFDLFVPRDSPYSDPSMSDLDVVFSYPGTFPAIANGYVVILKNFQPRREPYRLCVDAKGRGNYRATAFVDIKVVGSTREAMEEFSLIDTFNELLKARSISLSKPDSDKWREYLTLAEDVRKEKRLEKLKREAANFPEYKLFDDKESKS